jgi:hypothetical protein
MNHRKEIYVFMSKVAATVHEINPDPKQIKIPYNGQLSKQGTVIRRTRTAEEVDYSIASIVDRINHAGFITQFSCSGLKKDHPLKAVNPDGAYISFPYEENHPRTLNLIEKAAMSLNLTVEYCRMSRNPALIVRIDKDRSGNSLTDRISIAGKTLSGGSGQKTGGSFGACTKDLQNIIKRNGGLVYDTDEKIEAVWKRFANLLLYLSVQNAS